MAFDSEQRGVITGIIPAFALSLTALALAFFADLAGACSGDWAARAKLLALALIAPAASLIQAIAAIANHRFADPIDRNAAMATTATQRAQVLQAILRNTHEQAFLALLVYIVAAIWLPPSCLDAIVYSSLLFLTGRIAFTLRYTSGAAGRAFGFGLTFYPTILLGLVTMVTMLP